MHGPAMGMYRAKLPLVVHIHSVHTEAGIKQTCTCYLDTEHLHESDQSVSLQQTLRPTVRSPLGDDHKKVSETENADANERHSDPTEV